MKVQIIECAKGWQAEVCFSGWTAYTTRATLTREAAIASAHKLAERLGTKVKEIEYTDEEDVQEWLVG